jgi:lysophospholipase L1-like esterase
MEMPVRGGRSGRVKVALGVATSVTVTLILLIVTVTIADAVAHLRFADELYRGVRRHPPDPYVQVRAASQVDGINPQGFRGAPIDESKPPNTLRIFVLGGSTMLGVANPYRESFPAMLQARLAEQMPDRRIEVENAATAWWSTAHTVVDYELRVRRYHPDLILVVHGINDLYRSFSPPAFATGPFKPDYSHYQGPYARFKGPDDEPVVHAPFWPPSRWLIWLRLRESLFNEPRSYDHRADNVRRLLTKLEARHIDEFKSLPSFRNFYELLIADAQRDKTTIVIGSHPSLYRLDLSPEARALLLFAPVFANEHGGYPDLESMMRGMAQFNDAARQIAAAHDVPFVDVAAAVPRTAEYFTDDVHLKKEGNWILAKTFGDWIMGRWNTSTR